MAKPIHTSASVEQFVFSIARKMFHPVRCWLSDTVIQSSLPSSVKNIDQLSQPGHCNWRARHYQGCTNSSWCGVCVYIYVYGGTCAACHTYVMWAELGHCHFLYVPAVLNVVTTRNSTGTKNVLKWNHALGFEFSIQSSVYGATTVVKVSLFCTWTRSTVSFYSM